MQFKVTVLLATSFYYNHMTAQCIYLYINDTLHQY